MPICRICNKEFKVLHSNGHLRVHGINMQDYKKMFPDYDNRRTVVIEEIDKDIEEISDNIVKEEIFSEKMTKDENIKTKINEIGDFREEQDNSKRKILNFLKYNGFKNIKNNYVVRIFNENSKTVKLEILTDMADPSGMVIFDFPRSFFHNEQLTYSKLVKDNLLRSLSWKVITINEKMPKPESLFDFIKI